MHCNVTASASYDCQAPPPPYNVMTWKICNHRTPKRSVWHYFETDFRANGPAVAEKKEII